MARRKTGPLVRRTPGIEPGSGLPSLEILEQFSAGSLALWLSAGRKLEQFSHALFFGLERHRAAQASALTEAIRSQLSGPLQFRGWARIVDYRDHFYVDLVLYHTILRCNVLVELKCGKFEPRDLGQLQFYVNYYDAERRRPDENLTLGLLLCADKNNAVVRCTIGKENGRLFASKYLTHVPTEAQLQERIRRELRAMRGEEQGGVVTVEPE